MHSLFIVKGKFLGGIYKFDLKEISDFLSKSKFNWTKSFSCFIFFINKYAYWYCYLYFR